jgi:vancomycin resistance protein VanW
MMAERLSSRVMEYERPKRVALSRRFPWLVGGAVLVRRTRRTFKNSLSLKKLHKGQPLPSVVARHSSPLFRRLGDSDMRLQVNKVVNLNMALQALDGIVIPPGQVFSFWHVLGPVTRKKGYVDGMLLSNGQVSEGLGGGLCQLSNFLFWIFLHANMEVLERHHHSVDAFPDSKRTLPFGSGATVFSNYLDLRMRNISPYPLQLKLWLTETCLKGQLRSTRPALQKFHVLERNHCFAYKNGRYYRYNEIYRQTLVNGSLTREEPVGVSFAPVVYPVTDEYLAERGYETVEIR